MRWWTILVFAAALRAELKLPKEARAIYDLAQAAPAEFASDALLKLVENGKVTAPAARTELIERAFSMAAAAHFHAPLKAVSGLPGQTRQSVLAAAYALKLDTASLQARSAAAMERLDAKRARQMAGSIVREDAEPPCEQGLYATKPSEKPCDLKTDRYWATPQANALSEAVRAVWGGRANTGTQEWQDHLAGALRDLNAWTAAHESSETDFFHQKAMLYELLMEAVPAGSERDRILEEFLSFAVNSYVYQESPVEWYFHWHSLLNSFRARSEAGVLLARWTGSGNPVLELEAALEIPVSSRPSYPAGPLDSHASAPETGPAAP